MSDYSCTTINSEMNRSIGGNEVSEEEEEDENAEPFQMPEESESQHESYSQDVRPDEFLNKNKGNLRRVPREHSPEMPPPPVEQPPQHESESEEEQYIQPHKQNQDYHEPPVQYNHQSVHSQVNQGRPSNPRPVTDQSRNDRISDPAKLPFSQRVNLFKQSQNDNQRQEYKNYIKSMRDPAQPRLGPKPFRPRSPQGQGQYDSGLERDDMPTRKNGHNFNQSNDPSITESDADTEVVATARGTFDTSGGVLSSVETGVSIVIPRGAIPPGVQQEIYFKVCRDLHDAVPPLDHERGERLLSPMVMCGPHGLRFNHPVELRLPHCASMTPDGWSFALKSSDAGKTSSQQEWQNMQLGDQVGQNSVSVLIDHF